MAAGAQLAGRQFLIADVEQHQGLHAVDLEFAAPFQLVLDDIEKLPVQTFDQGQRLEITRPHCG